MPLCFSESFVSLSLAYRSGSALPLVFMMDSSYRLWSWLAGEDVEPEWYGTWSPASPRSSSSSVAPSPRAAALAAARGGEALSLVFVMALLFDLSSLLAGEDVAPKWPGT